MMGDSYLVTQSGSLMVLTKGGIQGAAARGPQKEPSIGFQQGGHISGCPKIGHAMGEPDGWFFRGGPRSEVH
jgi:hypothetical protein